MAKPQLRKYSDNGDMSRL